MLSTFTLFTSVDSSRKSGMPSEELLLFRHTLVRLYSMLHAVALSSICHMEDENFPIIDIQNMDDRLLCQLARKTDSDKVEVVYTWIQAHIVRSMKTGLVSMPAPIMTLVFHVMEQGMSEYQQVLLIMTIPFPFPYAQVTLMLVYLYTLLTPFMMLLWTKEPWVAFLFSFISTFGIVGINSIATQLEDPLGDDSNDLPCHEFHQTMNVKLLMLLDPLLFEEGVITSGSVLNLPELGRDLEEADAALLSMTAHGSLKSAGSFAKRHSQISPHGSAPSVSFPELEGFLREAEVQAHIRHQSQIGMEQRSSTADRLTTAMGAASSEPKAATMGSTAGRMSEFGPNEGLLPIHEAKADTSEAKADTSASSQPPASEAAPASQLPPEPVKHFIESVVKEVQLKEVLREQEDVKVMVPQDRVTQESMTAFLDRLESILRPTIQAAAASTAHKDAHSGEQPGRMETARGHISREL